MRFRQEENDAYKQLPSSAGNGSMEDQGFTIVFSLALRPSTAAQFRQRQCSCSF
jgi:hypothetical protein